MKAKGVGALLIESAMIITSILISFYIEDWRKDRDDRRKEVDYLSRIVKDLKSDSLRIVTALSHFERVEKKTQEFLFSYNRWDGGAKLPVPNDSIIGIIFMIHQPREPFVPASPAYSSLKSNGELDIIQNTALADQVIEYYERNIERLIMQDYLDLIKNEVQPYFGPNIDVLDFIERNPGKSRTAKTDFLKLYRTNQTKSCIAYINLKAASVNRYLPQRLQALSKLSAAISQELEK